MQQTILCFGDSNTWGYNPKDGSRYPSEMRWTGVLQQKLGPGFRVIEEGLNGRTTTINEMERPMRSAADILPVLIESHRPFDFIVLMLGTNDLKTHFNRSSDQIAEDLSGLCTVINEHPMLIENPPKLILAEPTGADLSSIALPEWFENTQDKWSELIALMPDLAKKHKALYLPTHKMIQFNFLDSLHWSVEQHELFAQAVCALIKDCV
jgi:lysophospholipase L1-like esterase